MLRIYCKYCGSPSMYTLDKPKFCQGCGKDLEGAISPLKAKQKSKQPPKKSKVVIQEHEDDIEEWEDEEFVPPDMNELDIEIAVKGPTTHTFGQLSDNTEPSIYDGDLSLPKDERPSGEILNEIRKEAGYKGPKKAPPEKAPSKRPRGRPKKK